MIPQKSPQIPFPGRPLILAPADGSKWALSQRFRRLPAVWPRPGSTAKRSHSSGRREATPKMRISGLLGMIWEKMYNRLAAPCGGSHRFLQHLDFNNLAQDMA